MLAQKKVPIGVTTPFCKERFGKARAQNDEDCVDEAKKKGAAVLRPYNIKMNGF
jgi:hypothetical protein